MEHAVIETRTRKRWDTCATLAQAEAAAAFLSGTLGEPFHVQTMPTRLVFGRGEPQ